MTFYVAYKSPRSGEIMVFVCKAEKAADAIVKCCRETRIQVSDVDFVARFDPLYSTEFGLIEFSALLDRIETHEVS